MMSEQVKNSRTGNIFHYQIAEKCDNEYFNTLVETRDFRIEQIVSTGHQSDPDFWYEQEQDEWVMVTQGWAQLEVDELGIISLSPGDYFFLPARLKHRVHASSTQPPCIWLAVHGNPLGNTQNP